MLCEQEVNLNYRRSMYIPSKIIVLYFLDTQKIK